jgi:hypothetical protein
VREASNGGLEGPDRVEAPAGEWPRRRYGSEDLRRDVLLLGEELAPRAFFHDVLGVGEGRRPVKARPECLSD